MFDEMLEAWRYTRTGFIAEVRNFPEWHFTDKPPKVGRTALDLVNHVVESGRLMAGELSRPDGDFQRKPYHDLIAEHARAGDEAHSKEAALAVLQSSFDEGVAALSAAGAELLMQPIRQFNGENATRIVWLHHGIAHEEYHRGQIALYTRIFGETPALTKEIYGG